MGKSAGTPRPDGRMDEGGIKQSKKVSTELSSMKCAHSSCISPHSASAFSASVTDQAISIEERTRRGVEASNG